MKPKPKPTSSTIKTKAKAVATCNTCCMLQVQQQRQLLKMQFFTLRTGQCQIQSSLKNVKRLQQFLANHFGPSPGWLKSKSQRPALRAQANKQGHPRMSGGQGVEESRSSAVASRTSARTGCNLDLLRHLKLKHNTQTVCPQMEGKRHRKVLGILSRIGNTLEI